MDLPTLEKATSLRRCCSAQGNVGMGKQARPCSRGVLSHEKSESAVGGKQNRRYFGASLMQDTISTQVRVLQHAGSKLSCHWTKPRQ